MLIFILLFNYMIIIKLNHTIDMERVTACVSGNDFFPECIVFYCFCFCRLLQPVPHTTLLRLTSIQSPTPTSTLGEGTPASPSE